MNMLKVVILISKYTHSLIHTLHIKVKLKISLKIISFLAYKTKYKNAPKIYANAQIP